MDLEQIERVFSLAMRDNGGLIIAGLASVLLILIAVFVVKSRKKKQARRADMMAQSAAMAGDAPAAGEAAAETPKTVIIDDDIDLPMTDDAMVPMAADATDPMAGGMTPDATTAGQSDTDAIADFGLDTTPPDQLDADVSTEFSKLDGPGMDDLDDITIPQVGQAPPPQKSRFFSASWLGHGHHGEAGHDHEADDRGAAAGQAEHAADPTEATGKGAKRRRLKLSKEDKAAQAAAAECARLAEIERKMLALRELYEAGLIAPEVYVLKAREFAAQA